MLQKRYISSALISIIILTIIFTFLLNSINKILNNEKYKAYNYLYTSITTEIKNTQGEILRLFEKYSELSRVLRDKNKVVGPEDLKIFNNKIHINNNFPQVVTYAAYIDLTNDIKCFSIGDSSMGQVNYVDDIDILKSNKFNTSREILYIEDFNGFIALPINKDENNQIIGIVAIGLTFRTLVNKYLPDLLVKNLSNFNTSLLYGYDLKNYKKRSDYDVIIELNEVYEFKKREDFFINKDFINIKKISSWNILDNHLYLAISGKSGNISEQFKRRGSLYYLVLSILYIVFIGSIVVLIITTNKIKSNIDREREFTSLISHELKTPLSVIRLGIDNLTSGVVNDKEGFEYYGNMITVESKRLQRMIDNILMISTKSWCNRSQWQPENIISVLDEIEENIKHLLNKHNVVIDRHINCKSGRIYCHRPSMVPALQNIVRNGIIYGASKSDNRRVLLEVNDRKKGFRDGISVKITNYGPRIRQYEQKKIFRSYYRGEIANSGNIEGSGLGLTITRKVIKDFGGSFTLEKSDKTVTSFVIWLPQRKLNV